jgi:hypothetical protein
MKKFTIFISWSRNPAKDIGEKLQTLLKKIFPYPNIDFFLSSSGKNEIVAGEDFRNKLDNNLMDSNFGILILTKNNFERPWMMFESGALSNGDNKSRIIPIFFNRDSRKIESPIEKFQNVEYNKEGLLKIIFSITKSLFDSNELDNNQKQLLVNQLDTHWESFKKDIDIILEKEYMYEIENIQDDVTTIMLDEKAYENILPRREKHFQELIDNLIHDKSKRIIIFGGISTILRDKKSIIEFSSWLVRNQESKLFFCYENEKVASIRAKEVNHNALNKDNKDRIDVEYEVRKRKAEVLEMKKVFLKNTGELQQNNLYFIEIDQTVTTYITVHDTTIFMTPVLDKRGSDTFTFKLNYSAMSNQFLEYIPQKISDYKFKNILVDELQQIKDEGIENE